MPELRKEPHALPYTARDLGGWHDAFRCEAHDRAIGILLKRLERGVPPVGGVELTAEH